MDISGSSMSSRQQGSLWYLSCCAARVVEDDEDLDGLQRAGPNKMSICNSQPLPMNIPLATQTQHNASGSTTTKHIRNHSSFSFGRPGTARSREPAITALPELPAPTIPSLVHARPSTTDSLRRRPTLSRRSFSLRRPSTARSRRPTIGAPTELRRVETLLGVSSDFKPLTVSVITPNGRLSPLPDFNEMSLVSKRESTMSFNLSDFEKKLLADAYPEDLEFGTNELTIPRTAENDSAPDSWSNNQVQDKVQELLDDLTSSLPPTRPQTRARANTEPFRKPKRKRSGLLQKEKSDVDDAIRELESIVEEKRAGGQGPVAGLTRSSSRKHVPAIAPAMAMRVRTKTLSDIGSAFSRPFSNDMNEPDSPTLGTETGLAQIGQVGTVDALYCKGHKKSPSSNSTNSKTVRFKQVSRWLTLSRTSTPSGTHFEDCKNEEEHGATRMREILGGSNAHHPFIRISHPNRSSESLASTASSASTISTSRFPTAPTTPPLSRTPSQATSGKLRSSQDGPSRPPKLPHQNNSPPLPSADESRWATAVGIAA